MVIPIFLISIIRYRYVSNFTVFIQITSASFICVTTDHTKNVTVKHTLSDHQEYIKYITLKHTPVE
jgi:hypothetical protein